MTESQPQVTSRSRRGVFYALVGGLLLGSLLGPTVAWAADRVDLNWPSVFRIAADRTLPFEAARTVPVKVDGSVNMTVDRYNFPTLKVEVTKLPPVTVEGGRSARTSEPTSFSTIRETDSATVFVSRTDDGHGQVYRLDHQTNQVTRLSSFEL